jgi:CubicO group peptidase (beta-lactamase class C family)
MKTHFHSLICLIFLFPLVFSACSSLATDTTTYWPTHDWRTSTPEQQGMDSELLVQMMEQIQSKQINLHSLIILRHGYIVAEAYFQPYEANNRVEIYSITKSIVSALVGIAIKQGSIDSVNHKVLDYFPDLAVANNDARKQAIALEHLLTMSSGLEWSDEANNGEMDQSQDAVKYVLDRPMGATPGQVFTYNSGAPTILTAILRKTTGKGPLEFAQANLFGPLGISDIRWKTNQNGLEVGGAGIQLTPRDMAKFGYLYLRNGLWEGKQIVPASWVNASLEEHVDPKMKGEKRSGYGYLWWLQTSGATAAQGLGGQYILLLPAQDLEVVFTAGLSPQEFQMPYDLFESYILAAIRSSAPLPANPTSAARLEMLLNAAAQPEPKPVPPLPPVAQRISGKTFLADSNNPSGIQSFSFAFQGDTAVVNSASRGGGRGQWQIGLDGIYRVNSNMIGMEAARGVWQDEKTLVLDFESLSGQGATISTFTFTGDTVVVSIASNIYPSLSVSGIAHLER